VVHIDLVGYGDPPLPDVDVVKASDANGCELRGTLHWVGDTLVNEYVEESTKMRDVWTDITPTSYTLTEEHDNGHGVMQPHVVSRITKMP
jgi:hypothetical protein